MDVSIPFGVSELTLSLDESRVRGVLLSTFHSLKAEAPEAELVRKALRNPVGSPRASELARGKKTIVVITSDQTRPVPSRITLPLFLEELRLGAPEADITVVVATGCHRAMTPDEMKARFGEDVFAREKFLVHLCDDPNMRSIGTLPSGGDCIVNNVVLDADLVVAEGFIEPHFFAGFSGGRKSVLPGVANRRTVLANHCAEFIDNGFARTGILDNNPIHEDMLYAARTAGLVFILNVVLNADKKIIAAFAGDTDAAHRAGCEFVGKHVRVKAVPADIVVTSNGGYPLDQNIYQAVKGMTAGEASVRKGGVVIIASECNDGHASEEMANCFAKLSTPGAVMEDILSRGRNQTLPDQWQIQIFCRILLHATVIMVTGPAAPREMVEKMGMQWAASLDDAMRMAEKIAGGNSASVTVIPDGVGVIVEK